MIINNIKTVGADSISALLDAKTNMESQRADMESKQKGDVESQRADIKSKQRADMESAPTGYKYNRCSLRLKHYDYSRAGYYFITVCAQNREHLFGEIVDGVIDLNVAGEMVHTLWYAMKDDFPDIALHEFIIMPNHIHGIIEIKQHDKPVGADSISAREPVRNHKPTNEMTSQRAEMDSKRADIESAPTLGTIIQSFKRHTTIQYIKMVKNGTLPPFNKRIWQRNYYEHVIRDEADYERVATYTINNPTTWHKDTLNT